MNLPFNIFDYVVFAAFLFYILEDVSFGIIPSVISLISIVSSFFFGLIFYPSVSQILTRNLFLTKGIADALSFLACTTLSFPLVSFLLSIIRRKYIKLEFPKKIDMAGGAVAGSLSFFFIAAFIVSLLLSFPTSSAIRDSIRNSVSGRFLSQRAQGIDREVRKIFGGAIEETINFLTIKPESNETVNLRFTVSGPKTDQASEQAMFQSLNEARVQNGKKRLEFDTSLTNVARAHAKDMLERGYFSHYTPEGLSPFDRLAEAGINYTYAGENLAFAPDVQIAMDGLMKSPGHRANILSPNFGKVGIGVMDAGIFGKMFVQEFTD